ncbi:site-2 protease family protein [Rhodopirellula sp. JC740]|uniref:Site-2 protease family protein n=1 Tax=Rhodopirellula halodulae TaxID=2894198 RepID=A0ABS8NQK7_9BACT|nr:site-2 protease family protein [Rhodopirellula sp. JC740]MCC9645247.1 site-2 protease family protein [Rhodopirellula sp. JC740]
MLLQQPQESPYDLHFELFGFPIRIAWTFWLGAAVFGWYLVEAFDRMDGSPGRLPLLLLWAMCMLVSILIHELGHAFAFRQNGMESSIVLYHFGGLAIPRSTNSYGGFASSFSTPRMSNLNELWIALAGPLAQLASAALLVLVVKLMGFRVLAFSMMPWPFYLIPGVLEGNDIDSPGLLALVTFYVWPSVLWAALNLIPVFPLDGGRIMRSLVLMGGGQTDTWLWISMIVGGACTIYGFQGGQMFLGILFLSLAVGNYQMLQGSRF